MAETGRLEELQRKFEENPRRFFAPLANEYRKAGSVERAIELCREFLPQSPGHMSGYVVYGQALFDGGQHTEAGEAFQRALAVDPENIIAMRHLGDIARYTGDRDLAAQWYRRVIEIDPKNEDVRASIAALSSSAAEPAPPNQAEKAPLHAVHPEPEPDPDAVVLSELVEEPDIPLTEPPVFSTTEIRFEQFGDSQDATVDVAEASAALDQMLAEQQRGIEASPIEVVEPIAELPLITEFTVSVSTVQRADTPVPATPVAVEPPIAEPMVAETVAADPFAFAPEVREEPAAPNEVARIPFVTETMADLYLQQGFVTQALDVYRRLAATSNDPEILEKIQRLERSLAEQGASASGSAPFMTVRDFFARIGARRPGDIVAEAPQSVSDLSLLFGGGRVDDSDARAASALAGAFPPAH